MSARKIKAIVFAVVFAVILFGPLGNIALSRIAPDTFSTDCEMATTITKPTTRNPIKLVRDSAAMETMRTYVNSLLSNSIPYHDNLMLLNASLGRLGTKTADILTGNGIYATYYGSEYYVDEERGRVVMRSMIVGQAELTDSKASQWVDLINYTAQQHPETNFVYAQPYLFTQSDYNPTALLTSYTRLGQSYMKTHIMDLLDSSVQIVDKPYTQEESDALSNTDHHWTTEKALETYNAIGDILGWTTYSSDDLQLVTSHFYGLLARGSMDLDYPTEFYDLPEDFSYLEWEETLFGQETAAGIGTREAYYEGTYTIPTPVWGLYDTFYGETGIIAHNPHAANDKTCVVVASSFDRVLKRLIASNYSTTIFVSPTNGVSTACTLESYFLKYDPDDVIYLEDADSIARIGTLSPEFLTIGGGSADDPQ